MKTSHILILVVIAVGIGILISMMGDLQPTILSIQPKPNPVNFFTSLPSWIPLMVSILNTTHSKIQTTSAST